MTGKRMRRDSEISLRAPSIQASSDYGSGRSSQRGEKYWSRPPVEKKIQAVADATKSVSNMSRAGEQALAHL